MDQSELERWIKTPVDPETIRAAAREVDSNNKAPEGFLKAVEMILDARHGRKIKISLEGYNQKQPRKLSMKAIKIIAKAIMQSEAIRSLKLYHCGIDDNQAVVLFAALQSNFSITELDLGWNCIGSKGYNAMVEML